MSITSTVVTVRILEELGMLQDTSSTLLLGISIVEDTIAISALAVIQSIAADTLSTGNEVTNLGTILQLLISIGVVTAFIGGIIILGSRYLPNVVDKIGKTHDYALILLVILGLAIGLSLGASLLGLSVATGAFFAGYWLLNLKALM